MSRSYRHTQIFGRGIASSDKRYKVAEHRRERHHVRRHLQVFADDEHPRLHLRPFGDPWGSPKDGKVYWCTVTKKDMRK